MNLQEFYQRQILDFIKSTSPKAWSVFKPAEWRYRIKKHMEFNTLCCLWDRQNIACVTTFNIAEDSIVIHHCIVNPEYRGIKTLKAIIREIHLRYQHTKDFKFVRDLKYPGRKPSVINISRFLKEK